MNDMMDWNDERQRMEREKHGKAQASVGSTDGLGVNRVGNAILCYAWGETDRPDACLVKTAEDVRRFLITEAFGDEKDSMLAEWMKELAEWDWREDGKLEWEFEIGGVRLEDVCDGTPNE